MATQVQNRRGTTAEHSTFTGAVGEVTIDTDKDTVVVHDGSTAGGRALLREDGTNSALALGSAGTPSLKFTGDTNTGIYSPGADQVAISTNGTGRLFVDASGNVTVDTNTFYVDAANNRVGIGLTTPAAKLELRDNTQASLSWGDTAAIGSLSFDGSSQPVVRALAGKALVIQTDGANERLRITSDGKVGVGTSSPGGLLHVQSNLAGNNQLILTNIASSNSGAGSEIVFTQGASGFAAGKIQCDREGSYSATTTSQDSALAFFTAADGVDSEKLRITSAGLVGVGTSSPGVILDIRETATGATTAISLFNTDNTNSTSQTARIGLSPDSRGAALTGLEAYKENSDFSTSAARDVSLALNVLLNNAKSEAVRITSAGLVGIGTSAPAALLTTKAAGFTPSDNANFAGVGLFLDTTASAGDGNYGSAIAWTRPGGVQYVKTAIAPVQEGADIDVQGLGIFTSSGAAATDDPTEKVRITSTGSVGIGTTSPNANSQLHIAGSSYQPLYVNTTASDGGGAAFLRSGTQALYVGTAGGNWLTGSSTADGLIRSEANLIFATGGNTQRAQIDSSGRLLVGTSSFSGNATQVLQGQSAGSAEHAVLWINRGSSASSGNALGTIRFADSSANQYAQIDCFADATTGSGDYPGRLVFSTTADGASSPTERMRIDNAGNVMIRTTSSNPNNSNSAFFNIAGYIGVNHINGTGSGTGFAAFNYNAGEIGSITQNGTTAVSYNTTSDYRLKENVIPVTDGIARLQQLKPSRFNFIADPERTVDGFIAHEVQDVIPEAITGEKDAVDDEGNPKYQGIDQSKLVPLLTAALQEAIGEIESLKARVAALESA